MISAPVDATPPPRQSETAFVEPLSTSHYRLRWFTPTTEVPLCGHATLAAAAALVDAGAAPPAPCVLTFDTRHSGALGVRVEREAGAGDGGGRPLFELDLPARPPTDALPACAAAVAAALVAGSCATVASLAFNADLAYLVATLTGGRAALASLAPSPAALLAAAPAAHVSGVIATTRDGGDGGDGDGPILSRFFGPWLGVDEDPVTGSAHAVLGPLWLGAGGGAADARQLSARGGELRVRVDGARVAVAGRARVVVRGEVEV